MSINDFINEFEYELLIICKPDEIVKNRLMKRMKQLLENDYEVVIKNSSKYWARKVLDDYIEKFKKIEKEIDKITNNRFK